MKIFFDARWTRVDTVDGITRYGASLVDALNQQHPVTMLIFDDRQLAHLPKNVPWIKINNPLGFAELTIATQLNRLGADIVISPMHVIGGGRRRYKLLLTLHDMIYYHHPQAPTHLPLLARIVWRLFHMTYWPGRALLNRADYILTVSETSKKLITQYLHPRPPIAIIPNAPTTLAQPRPVAKKVKKDLVYIGSFMPYKNVETLIRMMAYLPGYTLHLGSRISAERCAELEAMIPSGAKVRFWNGISDEAYGQLLKTATALVTASKDEGFGLPIIEAMANSTPAICSDIAIFREVGGQAAYYAPADDAKTFAEQVKKLEHPATRTQAIKLGHKQAAKYSWHASAQQLLKIAVKTMREKGSKKH